ncbi:threonine dehydratase [Niveibacterium umoris]|uniref:Threonine dehydratase n=1 Tax=Niveibacterium umoris TaxID=1193620 RepID=A0A840BIK7_9RHOO|nr:threonine dehydratase [Niveibacterium umoris]MBB4011412.1 threonine dehydratase [Niveibacterium umoris]
MKPTHDCIQHAANRIRPFCSPTPHYRWPLLCASLGKEVWVKHENHLATGAFKVRGGLNYFASLAGTKAPRDVVCATRGNHGQSIALAGAAHGFRVHVVVPRDNSSEKNAAMRALGANLIEFGEDFQAAREHAAMLANTNGWHLVPAFHPDLVAGVATYALEFLQGVEHLDTVYVPVGMGSGLCGMIAARDALGLSTEIVGVVSAHAPAYAVAFETGRNEEAAVSTRLADGMACRRTDPAALALIREGTARFIRVSDDEVAAAMRLLFTATHNVAEGAGAASLAAAIQDRDTASATRVGVVLSGGNVDSKVFAEILAPALQLPCAA